MDWIKVDRWSSLKAGTLFSQNGSTYGIMRGRPSGDNIGVISPEYTIKCDWVNNKQVPVKKKDGSWCVLPPGFSLGDDKEKALEILKALTWQMEQL